MTWGAPELFAFMGYTHVNGVAASELEKLVSGAIRQEYLSKPDDRLSSMPQTQWVCRCFGGFGRVVAFGFWESFFWDHRSRPLGYLIFSLMALIRDSIY